MGAVAGVGNAVKRDQVGLSWIFRQFAGRCPGGGGGGGGGGGAPLIGVQGSFSPRRAPAEAAEFLGSNSVGFGPGGAVTIEAKHFLGRGLAGGGCGSYQSARR